MGVSNSLLETARCFEKYYFLKGNEAYPLLLSSFLEVIKNNEKMEGKILSEIESNGDLGLISKEFHSPSFEDNLNTNIDLGDEPEVPENEIRTGNTATGPNPVAFEPILYYLKDDGIVKAIIYLHYTFTGQGGGEGPE